MKKRTVLKVVGIGLSVLLFLSIILAVHIYMVTRPEAATNKTVAMARLDFKQNIQQADADKITAWLYQQQGIDHVLCNSQSSIAVFTFHPVKANADNIVESLRSTLHYKVDRFMPSKEDMKKGCPVL